MLKINSTGKIPQSLLFPTYPYQSPWEDDYVKVFYYQKKPDKDFNWYLDQASDLLQSGTLDEGEVLDLEYAFDNQHKPEIQEWVKHFVNNRI